MRRKVENEADCGDICVCAHQFILSKTDPLAVPVLAAAVSILSQGGSAGGARVPGSMGSPDFSLPFTAPQNHELMRRLFDAAGVPVLDYLTLGGFTTHAEANAIAWHVSLRCKFHTSCPLGPPTPPPPTTSCLFPAAFCACSTALAALLPRAPLPHPATPPQFHFAPAPQPQIARPPAASRRPP